MSDVTRILSQIEAGDRRASAELLPLVYEELRKLAAARVLDILRTTADDHWRFAQAWFRVELSR